MATVSGSLNRVNWSDVNEVIELAKRMNAGEKPEHFSLVIWHPGSPNFNITFVSRTDRYKPDEVVWKP